MTEANQTWINGFLRATAWGPPLVESLRRDQVTITDVRRGDARQVWFLRLQLPEELRAAYGLAPEVLLIAITGELQVRDLTAGLAEISTSERRLDPGLVIVADARTELRDRLDRIANPEQIQRVAWSMGPYGPEGSISEVLKRDLPRFDVFDERDPVRGRQVIGRATVINDIRTRILHGQSLGVFGLRKMGKTTVVRAVTDHIDPMSALPLANRPSDVAAILSQSHAWVIWVDVDVIHEGTLHALVRRLCRELATRLEIAGFRAVAQDRRQPLASLEALVEQALQVQPVPLCIVLDESDWVFERRGHGDPMPELEKLLAMLRAIAQSTKRLSLTLIGRDLQAAQGAKLNGQPNPMLNWFVQFPLGPLTRSDADELLTTLGRRVGLHFGPESLEMAFEWTGGHPRMHRVFGSACLRAARERSGSSPDFVDVDGMRDRALFYFQDMSDSAEIGGEILSLLEDRYPRAADLLIDIASEHKSVLVEWIQLHGGWANFPARTLRNFGLIDSADSVPAIPRFMSWFIANNRLIPRSAHG